MHHSRLVTAGAIAASLLANLATAAPARADDATREQAKEAYDRGLDAHKHGEMARAAKEFAAADALQPSAQALQAALDAAIDADDVALGAELLERSKREPATPGLASSIMAATVKFNARTGRMRIVCPPQATCSAKLDDSPVAVGRVIWAPVGPRTVSVQVDGRSSVNKVVDIGAETPLDVVAGKELTVKPGTYTTDGGGESMRSSSSRPQREGLSPVVFYASAGVTVALAGITTFLMASTSSTHGEFEDKNCTRVQTKECNDLASEGRSTQSAANVMLVVTVVAALATTAIGIGFVNWRGGKGSSRSPNPFVVTF